MFFVFFASVCCYSFFIWRVCPRRRPFKQHRRVPTSSCRGLHTKGGQKTERDRRTLSLADFSLLLFHILTLGRHIPCHNGRFVISFICRRARFVGSTKTPESAVLAGSMQLLAGVKLCTGRVITNHPHYEDEELRDRTKQVVTARTMPLHSFVAFREIDCTPATGRSVCALAQRLVHSHTYTTVH